MYIDLEGEEILLKNIILKEKATLLFDSEESSSFSDFWEKYHTITKKPKTDKESASKYWRKLSKLEQIKAVTNIQAYFNSLSDSLYCKKARTYLSDKNFNDEFKDISGSSNRTIAL